MYFCTEVLIYQSMNKNSISILLVVFATFIISFTGCKNSSSVNSEQNHSTEVSNTAYENIMTRTSVRSYTDKLISADTVEMLLRAGMAAPTARNSQPWHFVAITDRAKLDELAETNRHGRMLKEAPLAIAVCGNMDKALEGDGKDYWIQDCSAATENILLAVNALGLGAVWTGVHPITERVESVSKVLNLPETIIPLCVIVIGYPNESPQPKDKWLPENVSYNIYE